MRALLLGLAVLLVSGSSAAAFDFDRTPGRLPKDVVPLAYTIAIVPNVRAKTFTGHERVTLRFRRSAARIVFNTLNLRLRDVRVDGRPVREVLTQNDRQLTTLVLARPLAAGRHVLTLAYGGKIETAPQGLFLQPYRTAAGAGVMLSTQLEATDARRVFPCWDEPAFRSTFTLGVTIPAAWKAVGNMPVARRIVHGSTAVVTFQPTPSMPAYLVELSAGDLVHVSARRSGILHGVWTVRGEESEAREALANSLQILDDYDAYYGFKYPLPKLDSIAIPGGFPGAMENWGAITYSERLLLVGPHTTTSERQLVFDVQAHEMSHQWTGDLVTLDWWNDIWLNESFAAWMEHEETAMRHPAWAWWETQDEDKQHAMNVDAVTTSAAIEAPVKNELQADASFDFPIVYGKGADVLRMFEAFLGPQTFRDGLRRYVRARAYSNASPEDLWSALSAASGRDVAALAGPWITQPGYPVVTVDARCDAAGSRTIVLAQKRFLLQGTDAAHERWEVPLQIRSGEGPVQRVVLTQDGQSLAAGRCGEPLVANAGGVGFYRVAYDPQTLAANDAAFASLPDPDKIALLDDEWAFARAGTARLDPYLELAGQMGSDLDARAWEQIIGAFEQLDRDVRATPYRKRLEHDARALVRPVAERLGWSPKTGESPTAAALRRAALLALGAWDDPATIAQARRRFGAFERARGSLSADEQEVVLPIVAQHADAATFARLHAIARSAGSLSQVLRYYGALVQVRDPRLAEAALQAILADPMPPQARGRRLDLVFQAADAAPQASWRFFQAHTRALMAGRSFVESAPFLAEELPDVYRDAAPLREIEAWLRARLPRDAEPYIRRGTAAAAVKLAEKARMAPEIEAYLSSKERTDPGWRPSASK
jgi:aminopeptidase N